MLAMLIEALGHQVVVEHHPRRALERAPTETLDVFLLDIGLPDMDGIELARRLRMQLETTKAILIAVTGYGQEQDRDAALNAGFDYYFAKPIDGAKLASLLAEIDNK
jgi:CheY-like chemotaxis protein